jgi:hemolysin activation/secretion protein
MCSSSSDLDLVSSMKAHRHSTAVSTTLFPPFATRGAPLVTALLASFSLTAQAAAPSAGDVLRETAPPAVTLPGGHLAPLQMPPAEQRPALRDEGGIQVTPRAFRITGNSVFSEAELQALLADLIGHETGFAGLRDAAERITRHYRRHGYLLARAWLPTQKLAAGIVEISVLEGSLGDIRLANRSSYSDADIAAFLDPNSLNGQVVEKRLLERKLLLLADIPGFEVKAELAPGSALGTTDMNVEVAGKPGVVGDVSFDNYGSGYTGRYRFGAGMQVVNPGGWGDIVSLRGLLSQDGLAYGRLAYQSAVGREGLRLGVSAARLHYALGKKFADLAAEGEAEVDGLNALYPLLRGVEQNLYLSLEWEDTKLADRVAATSSSSDKHKQVLTASLTGDWLGQGTSNTAAASLTAGNLDLRTPTVADQDALSAHSAGNFTRLNLDFSQQRPIGGGFILVSRLRSQIAGKNLDASEKSSLGGIGGIRAYPQGEAAGDNTFLVNLEARRLLGRVADGSPLRATLFLDAGMSRINQHAWDASDNYRTLSGVGASLDWGTKQNGATRIGFACRTSGGPASADKDSRVRLWIGYEENF